MKTTKITFAGALFACLAFLGAAPAFAQSSIKALVNNEPVTTNEINQRARFLHLINREAPNAQIQSLALEELVDEKLRFQEAKRRKLEVSDAQVNASFANIAQRVHLTPPQLVQALAQSGIEVTTLRNRLKSQIVWQQMVLTRFKQSVSISDQDVVKALQKQTAKDNKAPVDQQTNEYTITQVVFVVPAAAGKPGYDARQREAEQFRGKFTGCEALVTQARQYKETVVKPLGKRTEDELPAQFAPLLAETPAGKMTKPIQTPNGVEMLAVCEKREVAGNLVERAKVEDNLREREGQVVARQFSQELRRFSVIVYK